MQEEKEEKEAGYKKNIIDRTRQEDKKTKGVKKREQKIWEKQKDEK